MSVSPVGRISTRRTQTAFGFRFSAFLRPSDFGLRICPLLLTLLASQVAFGATTNPPSSDAIPPLRPSRAEIPPTFWEQHGVWVTIAGALVLGVVAFGVWWLPRPKPAVVVPPEAEARQALGSLRHKPEDGALLSQVSQILRRYVSAAFGLPPGEMTTTDFCRTIAGQARVGEKLSAALGDFLRKCDERKFAPPSAAATGKMPGATDPGRAQSPEAVAQALTLLEQAEARRAQLASAESAPGAPQAPRAGQGAAKA